MRRPLRIANISGFYGDRLSALAEMLAGGDVDVISGDYLAEVTMLVLAKAKGRDPEKGYATTFSRQLQPVLADILTRNIKVVTNAGGLNPHALAAEIRAMAAEAGVDIRVAVVDGDDLLPRLDRLQAAGHGFEHLTRGEPLAASGLVPLTANAYLGAGGIARALGADADVVVCGRVTDASLVVGPAMWWHGWLEGDLDRLAGAVAAGHVIECGAQATGGNYSSFVGLDLTHPGFPIAEIDESGESVITKHPGTGGAVTVGTVTAQLLYEIAGPRYLNPDVVARFDTTVLTQLGPDRVQLSGTRGEPAPPDTKVAITALGGWRNQTALMLTGLDIEAKANLVETAMRSRFDGVAGLDHMEFQLIGAVADDPEDQGQATCELRCVVTGQDPRVVGRTFSSALVELGLASYPGFYFTTLPGDASSFGTYWPALVPQAVVPQRLTLPDGTVTHLAPPTVASAEAPTAAEAPTPAEAPTRTGAAHGRDRVDGADSADEPLTSVPFGYLVDARSGDKGGDANVGVWVSRDEAWPWLRSYLTVERLRALVPEAKDLEVDRYELANLRAVNLVIHGLLGDGATANLHYDSQAKALGEYLRARRVLAPSRLLADNG